MRSALRTAAFAEVRTPLGGPSKRRWVLIGAIVAWALLTAVVGARLLGGSWQLAPIAVVALALAPLAAYATVRWPLIFPFGAYLLVLPFDTLTTVGQFGSAAKIVGLLCAAALVVRVARPGARLSPPRALAPWLLLLLWMLISAAWAMDAADSSTALVQYVALLALYSVLSVVPVTMFELNVVLGTTVGAGVLAAGYGAWLFRNGQDLISSGRVIIKLGENHIDPNNFASALVLPLAIALVWLFTARNLALRVLMFPAIGVMALGFATSGSRGGMLAALTMIIWLVIRGRYRLRLGIVTVCAAAVALAANPNIINRFAESRSSDAAGRTDIWRVGFLAFRDHWVAGAGVGNFANAFDTEYLNVFARYVLGWHWAAHNTFLEMAVECGVIGLGLLFVALWFQVRTLRVVPHGHALYEMRLALEGTFLGLLVAACSLAVLNQKYLWLCFALMVLFRSRVRAERVPRGVPSAGLTRLRARTRGAS